VADAGVGVDDSAGTATGASAVADVIDSTTGTMIVSVRAGRQYRVVHTWKRIATRGGSAFELIAELRRSANAKGD
jgi:hypothetical protein